jgi:hypothetical protein
MTDAAEAPFATPRATYQARQAAVWAEWPGRSRLRVSSWTGGSGRRLPESDGARASAIRRERARILARGRAAR